MVKDSFLFYDYLLIPSEHPAVRHTSWAMPLSLPNTSTRDRTAKDMTLDSGGKMDVLISFLLLRELKGMS